MVKKLTFDEYVAYANAVAKEVSKEMIQKYTLKMADEYEKAYKRIVMYWYAGYGPKYYNRSGSLLNAFTITPNPGAGKVKIDVDGSGMGSNQPGEKVFDIVFMKGYHGGSDGKGAPGGIAYRGPVPFYNNWTSPAVAGFSIAEELDSNLSEIDARLNSECESEAMTEYYRRI